MPSCRPPLLASWIKKEFLCGSFYAQVMLESVWTKEDEFLCFTRLKLFECSTKKLTGLTILLLCTWRKRGENNSKMFQKIFAWRWSHLKSEKAKRRRYFNIWFNKKSFGWQTVECHTGEKCSKLFKTSLKNDKEKDSTEDGIFLNLKRVCACWFQAVNKTTCSIL